VITMELLGKIRRMHVRDNMSVRAIGQRLRGCAANRCHWFLHAQTQHLGAFVAARHSDGQQTCLRVSRAGLPQPNSGGNKSTHCLRVAKPLDQPRG